MADGYGNYIACSANGFHWFLFIASIVLLCAPWWLFEIPILFQLRNDTDQDTWRYNDQTQSFVNNGEQQPRMGKARRYLRAVQWTCLRSVQPGLAAVTAVRRERSHRGWVGRFFFGFDDDLQDQSSLGFGRWTRIVIMDWCPLIVQAMLIYAMSSDFDTAGRTHATYWIIGLLPSAVTGISVSLTSRLPRGVDRFVAGSIGLLIHGCLCAGLLVAAIYTTRGYGIFETKTPFAVVMAVAWLIYIVPGMAIGLTSGPGLYYAAGLISSALRVAPIILSVFSRTGYKPAFCPVNGLGFAISIGIVGGGAVFYMSVMGLRNCPIWRRRVKTYYDTYGNRDYSYQGGGGGGGGGGSYGGDGGGGWGGCDGGGGGGGGDGGGGGGGGGDGGGGGGGDGGGGG